MNAGDLVICRYKGVFYYGVVCAFSGIITRVRLFIRVGARFELDSMLTSVSASNCHLAHGNVPDDITAAHMAAALEGTL